MSPIRVGLIGLGTQTNPLAPGAWAATSHLPGLQASSNYKIVALANSTSESAARSIAFHKLGPDVKAYGSAEDLSSDPDVDLVVVSVAVQKHFALVKPALLAGKDVFVEWPLGATSVEAEELTELATSKGVKTVVGVQARASSLIVKLKEIVNDGRIGQILSSSVIGSMTEYPVWPSAIKFYLDLDSGGNPLTIFFGHFLDSFTHVLGGFAKVQSTLKIQYPTVDLMDLETGQIDEPNYQKTAPDHILVQGLLESGATASLSYRSTAGKTVNNTSIHWIISGTEGEIELTVPEGILWQVGGPGCTLRIRTGKDQEPQNVDFTDSEEPPIVSDVPLPGTNTARVYEAYSKGDANRLANFQSALKTHHLLDQIRAASRRD